MGVDPSMLPFGSPTGVAAPQQPFTLAGFGQTAPFQPPPAPRLSPVPPVPPMPTIQGVNPAGFGSPMGQQLQGGIGQGLGYMLANQIFGQMFPQAQESPGPGGVPPGGNPGRPPPWGRAAPTSGPMNADYSGSGFATPGGLGSPTQPPAAPAVGASASAGAQPQLQAMASQAAEQNGLPADFFANLIQQESGWNPGAVGGAGERGLTQVMPGNLQAWGINPDDPQSQLSRSAAILGQYYQSTGSTVGAAISWNAGPGAWQKFVASGYNPSTLPASTVGYVKNVTGVDLFNPRGG